MSVVGYKQNVCKKGGGELLEKHHENAERERRGVVENARREYQLRRFVDAEQFHIPYENLEDPMVHRLASAARDTEALKNLVEPTGSWRIGVSERAALMERLHCSHDLLSASQEILEEQASSKIRAVPMLRSLTRAAHRYGWDIQETGGQVTHPPLPPLQPSTDDDRPYGLWRWPPHRFAPLPGVPEGYEPWWDNYHPHIDEDQRQSPERQARLAEEAAHLSVPAGLLDGLTLRNVCSVLVDAKDLLAESQDTEDVPDTPGLTPSGKQRLRLVTPLNQLVVAVIEEEFHPGHLTPERFALELSAVTKHYGLRIAKRDKPGTLEKIT